MRNVTEANFQNDVLNAQTPVLVDFYADWCGPCQSQLQLLEDLEPEIGQRAEIVKVNIDEETELARAYGVRSIPTLMLFQEGSAVATRVGLTPKNELNELLAQH